jgi:hypothetical protein
LTGKLKSFFLLPNGSSLRPSGLSHFEMRSDDLNHALAIYDTDYLTRVQVLSNRLSLSPCPECGNRAFPTR